MYKTEQQFALNSIKIKQHLLHLYPNACFLQSLKLWKGIQLFSHQVAGSKLNLRKWQLFYFFCPNQKEFCVFWKTATLESGVEGVTLKAHYTVQTTLQPQGVNSKICDARKILKISNIEALVERNRIRARNCLLLIIRMSRQLYSKDISLISLPIYLDNQNTSLRIFMVFTVTAMTYQLSIICCLKNWIKFSML